VCGRYVAAWREYSQGVAYLNSLYSYLNLQHVKRQKVRRPAVAHVCCVVLQQKQQS
jgi:hypothetical protein